VVQGGEVFFLGGRCVYRLGKDAHPEQVTCLPKTPDELGSRALAVSPDHVFAVSAAIGAASCTVYRTPREGGPATRFYEASPCPSDLAVDEDHLYGVGLDGVWRKPTRVRGPSEPVGVYDGGGRLAAWVDGSAWVLRLLDRAPGLSRFGAGGQTGEVEWRRDLLLAVGDGREFYGYSLGEEGSRWWRHDVVTHTERLLQAYSEDAPHRYVRVAALTAGHLYFVEERSCSRLGDGAALARLSRSGAPAQEYLTALDCAAGLATDAGHVYLSHNSGCEDESIPKGRPVLTVCRPKNWSLDRYRVDEVVAAGGVSE